MRAASTHSHQLWDPLIDAIDCDVRNTNDFKSRFWDCLWFTAVFKRKYSAMVLTYEFAHGLSYSKHHIDIQTTLKTDYMLYHANPIWINNRFSVVPTFKGELWRKMNLWPIIRPKVHFTPEFSFKKMVLEKNAQLSKWMAIIQHELNTSHYITQI